MRPAPTVPNWLWLLLGTLRVLLHDRHALLMENLLLRQQLAVALRARPRPQLGPDRAARQLVRPPRVRSSNSTGGR